MGSTYTGQIITCLPAVGADGTLCIEVDLRALNVPATRSDINMTLRVTVDGVTQDIYINTPNPLYQDAGAAGNQDEYKTAATMEQLKTILNENAADTSGKTYTVVYPAEPVGDDGYLDDTVTVDSTDTVTIGAENSLVIPANTYLEIRADSLTVGAEGSITLKAGAGRAASLYVASSQGNAGGHMTVGGTVTMECGEGYAAHINCGAYTVNNGGRVIVNDAKSASGGSVWFSGIGAETITVGNGAAIQVTSGAGLELFSLNHQSSSTGTCTLAAGSTVTVNNSYFHIRDFDRAVLAGNITAAGYGSLYFYNNTNQVDGIISASAGSDRWSNIEFYGETVIEAGGKIHAEGPSMELGVHGALTNRGTIELAGSVQAVMTNTGFSVRNEGSFIIGNSCYVSLEGTKLVNTGTISGSGTVSARLGYDLTDYAMNHTGLAWVTGAGGLNDYDRYKFTGEPAATIEVTLYKGELINESGGTTTGVTINPPEDYPAN